MRYRTLCEVMFFGHVSSDVSKSILAADEGILILTSGSIIQLGLSNSIVGGGEIPPPCSHLRLPTGRKVQVTLVIV
jgi:hypothetical protein